MAYGQGPFGGAPFGAATPPTSGEQFAALSSSRGIDGTTRRYRISADGGFEPMDDVAQRVLLIASYAIREEPIISPQSHATTTANIRAALQIMTSGNEPAIDLLDVQVGDDGGGRTFKTIRYKNLLTGTLQTLYPDGRLSIT